MNKLTIGLVCPYNLFRPGGVQEQVLAYQRELTKRGHTVFVIAPRPKRPPKEVEPFVLMVGQSTELNTPFRTTADITISVDPQELEDLFEHHKFDIVHFHEPWIPMMPRQLLSRSPAINVATFHAKLPETILNRSIEVALAPYAKSFFKKLHALTAVSEVSADYVRTISRLQVHIIPNGIDLSRYNPKVVAATASPKGKQTILFIGRLETRKGVLHLLKAYRQLADRRPGVRLVLAGDGPKRKLLERYVERYQLPNVEFLGFISDQEKLERLKGCDLFCSPALYGESFGIVLLEAMAFGKPVVAGNNAGYASVLKDRGKLGLVDPEDTAAFADRLELLLTDEQLRRLWHDWALKYVQQFDFPHLTDQYEALYEEQMKRHDRA